MLHRVFISHSSKDKTTADTICQRLESAGVKCWIAPRDIEAGSSWTEGIMQGIDACGVLILVFSEHANDSDHVYREVTKAFSSGLTVIPFRITEVLPNRSLSYFLDTVHWLDATQPPLPRHLATLTERVKTLLAGKKQLITSPKELGPATSARWTPGSTPFEPAKKRNWFVGTALAGICLLIAAALWFFAMNVRKTGESNASGSAAAIPAKSIAVLPFESLSSNKEDTYFADGVQDEILNNLAKIAQLKVISRTSVMQYRGDAKRDLRQIANALGVANVLEGTVRREGNHVRVSTELIDARNDNTVWADSFDRDLTGIFAIQSEVAQTIANKLTATLSPEEKKRIEEKPTDNLEAYDLYLQATELITKAEFSFFIGNIEKPLLEAISFLERAVRFDPKFALACCEAAKAHDLLYVDYDPTLGRRSLGDAAIDSAVHLQPDLPEVHLAYGYHLYLTYRDYKRARVQLAIARRGLPNNSEAMALEAYIDRRQGNFKEAIQELNEAITFDPGNPTPIGQLAVSLSMTRQYHQCEQVYNRLIGLLPDHPMIRVQKALIVGYIKSGDVTLLRSAIEALPASMVSDRDVLISRLTCALADRAWEQATKLLEKMEGSEDDQFAYGQAPVPAACYSILLARLKGGQSGANSNFAETRERLNQKVQNSPGNANLLSQLGVVDALLGRKEDAITQAKRAIEMLPISKDAVDGPGIEMNLAVVYAWTNELDLAFETLAPLTKTPSGVYYGNWKRDPYWEPLRKDPRYEKVLAELAPRD
jgi:TolB-like protein/Flp pilus assembly protein TadD